jgi:hypothetical protein
MPFDELSLRWLEDGTMTQENQHLWLILRVAEVMAVAAVTTNIMKLPAGGQ